MLNQLLNSHNQPETLFKFPQILSRFFNRKILSNLLPVGLMLLCLSAVIALQQGKLNSLTESKQKSLAYQQQENLEKVKLGILKNLPTFGFDNLLSDWTMLQFIQYYGDGDARKVTGYSLSPEYLEVITKNDPLFVSAYLIISPASSINAGRPDRTVALMKKGLKHLSPTIPESYFVWLYKGVDELLFLGDIKAAKNSYQMAANWAKIARNTKIANAASNTVKFLNKNPDSKAPQVGAWFMVFVNTSDLKTRQLAKQKIEELGGKLEIYPDGRALAIPPKE
jgi:hypothetical protein